MNGCVAIRGDKIEWVGECPRRSHKYLEIIPTCVSVLMPGLWDCHTHFLALDIGNSMATAVGFLPESPALAGAITANDLRVTLDAGELGGYAGDVWPAVKNGHLEGPNIYSAIGLLSIMGGHGDDQTQPLSTIADAMSYGSMPLAVYDGVQNCV
ncbi:hypothetical protein E4U58_003007 [Claviceps cyperi]|nr:hypothetical protein E4U58_003007 [Claviceps cyperi]